MTVADLLTLMSSFDNEADFFAGGTDESRGVAALNAALQYVQNVCAAMPRVLSARGAAVIATAANVEYATFPSGLLRLDRLWMLDTVSLLPIYPLGMIQEVGGHSPSIPLVGYTNVATGPGRPSSYYADSESIYFDPTPDAVYSIRAYGLWSRVPFVDRTSAFTFPDSLSLPFASFASRYTKMAIDDDASEAQKVAVEVFTPALRALRRRDRSSATSRQYAYDHFT